MLTVSDIIECGIPVEKAEMVLECITQKIQILSPKNTVVLKVPLSQTLGYEEIDRYYIYAEKLIAAGAKSVLILPLNTKIEEITPSLDKMVIVSLDEVPSSDRLSQMVEYFKQVGFSKDRIIFKSLHDKIEIIEVKNGN